MIRNFGVLLGLGLAGISLAEVLPVFAQVEPSSAITSSAITSITAIEGETTSEGFELRLQTPAASMLQPTQMQTGQQVIIDLPNARLDVSLESSAWRRDNPSSDIAAIEVNQLNPNTVRITVTGTAEAPLIEVTTNPQGLVLNVVPATDTAEALEPPATPTAPLVPPPLPDAIRIIVTGERDTYRVSESSVGTRTDAEIRDVPQSIQVVPQQVIEDQGIQQIGDALRNVSGVIQAERASTPLPGISAIIRGYESNNVLRNGLRDTNARFATANDNIAQIEILKGPASVLFGQGNLGGTINLVTELPLEEAAYLLQYSGGQYDFHRFALDFSSPFAPDSPLGYRLNASYDFTGSFRDFESSEFFFVAPTTQLINTEDTSLLVDVEYLRFQSRETAPELPAAGTVLDNPNGEVDPRVNLGEPTLVSGDDTISRIGYRFAHRFTPDWQLRNEFLLSNRQSESIGVTPTENRETGVGLNPGLRTVNRFLTINPSQQTSYTLSTSLSGRFTTGSIEHNLLLGVELLSDRTQDTITLRQLAPIDIFDPDYNPDSATPPQPFQEQNNQTTSVGFYLQDLIYLSDQLILLLGGRFDIARQDNEDLLEPRLSFSREDQAFSPRVGLVYRPVEPISLYASYTESFLPINGREVSVDDEGFAVFGAPFEPERGRQYEVGVKADISDTLSATLALYRLERSNVAAQGITSPLSQVQIGQQRSQGIELDIAGEITPGWQVIASYAYTDAEVTRDEVIPIGNRLPNVPEHAASLWTSYEIQTGDLQGLGFGVGLFFQSERQVGLQNLFALPSYLRTDASLFYRRDRFQASINIQNLFDVEYYPAGRDFVRIIPGQPFTIVGRLSWEF
ncbi:MAG: TonB-dependent siderophore receptor [Synechococcales cyanobacterium M58_A2018_015]|nr:TonB-dependent siderophore receptor [Synechococcales cyanobacterium M58_A2018_015]